MFVSTIDIRGQLNGTFFGIQVWGEKTVKAASALGPKSAEAAVVPGGVKTSEVKPVKELECNGYWQSGKCISGTVSHLDNFSSPGSPSKDEIASQPGRAVVHVSGNELRFEDSGRKVGFVKFVSGSDDLERIASEFNR